MLDLFAVFCAQWWTMSILKVVARSDGLLVTLGGSLPAISSSEESSRNNSCLDAIIAKAAVTLKIERNCFFASRADIYRLYFLPMFAWLALGLRVAAYEQVRPSAGFCGRERVNAERRRTIGTSTSTLIHEVFKKIPVVSWRVHRGLARWLACQRVGACRLAGLQTSQLRSLRGPSATVALRPL
jgi:hypothetical protein